jgi:hypothetical protein
MRSPGSEQNEIDIWRGDHATLVGEYIPILNVAQLVRHQNLISIIRVAAENQVKSANIIPEKSLSLQFAYSCASLILSRHILRQLSTKSPTLYSSLPVSFLQIETNTALKHSHDIMHLFLRMLEPLQNNITPAYNFLMCTNAAITIIEFPHKLVNIEESLALMENLFRRIQQSGREDKVFEWTLNVMRMAARDHVPITS